VSFTLNLHDKSPRGTDRMTGFNRAGGTATTLNATSTSLSYLFVHRQGPVRIDINHEIRMPENVMDIRTTCVPSARWLIRRRPGVGKLSVSHMAN